MEASAQVACLSCARLRHVGSHCLCLTVSLAHMSQPTSMPPPRLDHNAAANALGLAVGAELARGAFGRIFMARASISHGPFARWRLSEEACDPHKAIVVKFVEYHWDKDDNARLEQSAATLCAVTRRERDIMCELQRHWIPGIVHLHEAIEALDAQYAVLRCLLALTV